MPSALPVGPIAAALSERLFPTITRWNRLEARPRTPSFDRALQAEIRDPLWMLTKQWQMGEFRGSDAGSPTFAKLQIALTRLNKYQPDAQATQAFEQDIPLEAKVERRPIVLTTAGRPRSFDLRLAMGREWLRLIDAIGPYRAAFIAAYPIAAPDPSKKEDADVCAHQSARIKKSGRCSPPSPAGPWTAARCSSTSRQARPTTPMTASPALRRPISPRSMTQQPVSWPGSRAC